MEEKMNNLETENIVTEIVEETTDKLTFKENVLAYALVGVFVTGLATIGYLGYKGTKKLSQKIRNKKEKSEETEYEEAIDVEEEDIHDVEED